MLKLISTNNKNMANGMRDISKTPLTPEEISYIKSEIRKIDADESIFVFNDKQHLDGSTCYNYIKDVIYITRNIFPDQKYGSTHPRDRISVKAVLAHEYYGHRPYREEYLLDEEKGNEYHTTPIWQDECRASINAAKITPNLSNQEKADLIMDAIYRTKEFGYLIEMDNFMKEVVYGYSEGEKNIAYDIGTINFVSERSLGRTLNDRESNCNMSKVQRKSKSMDDLER